MFKTACVTCNRREKPISSGVRAIGVARQPALVVRLLKDPEVAFNRQADAVADCMTTEETPVVTYTYDVRDLSVEKVRWKRKGNFADVRHK